MGLLIEKDILSMTLFCISEVAAINYVYICISKSFQNAVGAQLDNWKQCVATLKQNDIEKMKEENNIK